MVIKDFQVVDCATINTNGAVFHIDLKSITAVNYFRKSIDNYILRVWVISKTEPFEFCVKSFSALCDLLKSLKLPEAKSNL